MRTARRWWSGRPAAANGTPAQAAGTETCPASRGWTMSRPHCRISSASTTAPRRGPRTSVGCRPALAAATRPARTASPGTRSTPPCARAATATTEALAAFRQRRPWDTRASTGLPPPSMAHRRCTSLPSGTGAAWTGRWTLPRAGPISWRTTGAAGRGPASSRGAGGTRPTPWSTAATRSWCNASTAVASPRASRSAATLQAWTTSPRSWWPMPSKPGPR
mmetsp:Transcript_42398/g.101082  ORF Transcript_42398/g.101082 Transcript_42398/m.101082 type:complete len:220 (+) Transcript_42398:170-829(+)